MGLLLQSKSFSSKNFFFNQKFEARSRIHIDFYIMSHPFNMHTIISMYTDLYFSRAIHIYWMENNPDGHLFNGFSF